jgi:hypothetical protein
LDAVFRLDSFAVLAPRNKHKLLSLRSTERRPRWEMNRQHLRREVSW